MLVCHFINKLFKLPFIPHVGGYIENAKMCYSKEF